MRYLRGDLTLDCIIKYQLDQRFHGVNSSPAALGAE
jgi:hypothetical protein